MADYADAVFVRLTVRSLNRAIARGWNLFSRTRPLSVTYAMLFAVIGVVILFGIVRANVAPMIFPMAGGFMLVGPVLLAGFFAVADRVTRGERPGFADIAAGYAKTSPEMIVIAFVCALLFMIWVTNAGTLYGFIVGRTPVALPLLLSPTDNVVAFLLWSSLIGIFLAFIIFSISAFSVPLLYYRRVGLVQAVYLSIAAVFANLVPTLLWALILSVGIIVSIVVFPLFLLTFPVLAFASHALYRELFPG